MHGFQGVPFSACLNSLCNNFDVYTVSGIGKCAYEKPVICFPVNAACVRCHEGNAQYVQLYLSSQRDLFIIDSCYHLLPPTQAFGATHVFVRAFLFREPQTIAIETVDG
jgi:hypothetical protein